MFSDEILSRVQKELVLKEGACGICHLTLKVLSEYGGKAVPWKDLMEYLQK